MKIDHSWGDDPASTVYDLRCVSGSKVRPEPCHSSINESDILHGMDRLGWVNQHPAFEE
jgi:hypothetical protein